MGLVNNNKDLYFSYLDGSVRKIIAQYVQISKDGKVVLNYLEKRYDRFISSFTEIEIVNGEWTKSPFHKKYDEYDFEKFDKEKSDIIIEQLPFIMRVRVKQYDDKKEVSPLEENDYKLEINSLGTKQITNNEKDVFVILLTSSDDYIVNKDNSYSFEFPFPTFSIDSETNHSKRNYEDDINKDCDFKELELSRCGLSFKARKTIGDLLKKNGEIIDVSILPTMNYNEEDIKELYRIHFVPCYSIETFNDVYKSKSIIVDNEMENDLKIEDLLKKAFNNEIPCYYESGLGQIKNNAVKHKGLIK